MSDAHADKRERLGTAGLRVTASRVAVLEVHGERPHATADTVVRLVGDRLGSVSKQAVHDVLAACARAAWTARSAPGRA